jgi:two-component system chemotaxis response regulator CheY
MATQTTGGFIPSALRPLGRSPRVLYAEDVRELREVMRLILQDVGYTIETVKNGAEAFHRLGEDVDGFDLLITDHHMPEMNGLELVHRLRSSPFRGKIMVFSSELDPAVHREYHRIGVEVILPKPVRPALLRKAMEELVPISR